MSAHPHQKSASTSGTRVLVHVLNLVLDEHSSARTSARCTLIVSALNEPAGTLNKEILNLVEVPS